MNTNKDSFPPHNLTTAIPPVKHRFTKTTVACAIIGLVFALLITAIILPSFICVRSGSASNACINNLRQIDGAKQTWALENHADSNTVPTWQNIKPYIGRGEQGTLPTCPEGGQYTIGKIFETPKCSVKGHKLD